MQSYVGDIEKTYTARGDGRFAVVVKHQGLGLVQEVKGADPNIVWQKAQGKARQWDERWAKKVAKEEAQRERAARAADKEAKKQDAEERTAEAQSAWVALSAVLQHTLDIDDTVDWDTLKDREPFAEPRPRKPRAPKPPASPTLPEEPDPSASEYRDTPGFFDSLLDLILPSRKAQRKAALEAEFQEDHGRWAAEVGRLNGAHRAKVDALEAQYAAAVDVHEGEVAAWKQEKADYLEAQTARNAAVDADKARYEQADPEAILDYCDLVLNNSEYDDWNEKDWQLDYNPESKLLIIEYALPSVDAVPRLKQVRYIQSRDEFTESTHSDAQVRKTYDSLLYQVALRTIHEVLEADVIGALDVIAFNGRVESVDPATGHDVNACVMSIQVNRDEFLAINLGAVDPKACFRKLKGVGSSKLHSLTPVAPISQIPTDDSRFTDSYEVRSTLDEGENLAVMDWEDFEHLVREVFELEFSGSGGTVKVTRASRDGGIDAVAFDPDPIRGGKIVIQAKRYTKTVGVSAVRDLYGAVMNEGANKGILVSTASYGPDAYAFVRDKPLTLVDGGTLLHLMQRHGHKVRINLAEARALRES